MRKPSPRPPMNTKVLVGGVRVSDESADGVCSNAVSLEVW